MTKNLKQALIIFAKRPVPGRVKTRLTPPLTPEEGAEIYRRMLLDTLAGAASIPHMEKFIFYEDEPEAAPYFEGMAGEMGVFPQKGRDLGERMGNAFRDMFNMGCGRVAIIGSDSPDLPRERIAAAFELLKDAEVVYGPCEDGGYYLVAMKRRHDGLFEGIPWSSGAVLAKSLEKAEKAGLAVALLPNWHDLDMAEDLQRAELLDEGNSAVLTREFLKRMKAPI